MLVEICKVLRPLLLVGRQLGLCFFHLSRMHVSLTQPVMRIRNIGIILQRLQILGNGIGIARLIRKKISQLEMRLAEIWIECRRFFK